MQFKNRLLYLAWFFFFCSLPLFKAFNSIAEVALVILSLMPGSFSGLKATVLRYKAVAGLTLIFGILLLGMLYTQDLANGWKILKHQHRFLVIPVLFLVHARFLQENFKKLLLSYVLSATLACAFIILLYLLPEEMVRNLANSTKLMLDYPEQNSRTAFGLYTPFIDRIQFSSLTAVAILSGIYLFISGAYRRWLAGAIPLLVFTMLILGGRGGQLALFVAVLVYATQLSISYFQPKLRQRWGKVTSASFLFAAGLLLFVGLPFLSYKALPPIQNRINQTLWETKMIRSGQYQQYDYAHFTTLRRIVSWQNMWQVIRQNPFLGVGTGDYHEALKTAYSDDPVAVQQHNHSQYLMVWAMTGLWGLALFLLVGAYWLWTMRHSGLLFYFATAVLVFYLVNMLPDAVLYTQIDSTLFCSFLALIGLQRKFLPEPNTVV